MSDPGAPRPAGAVPAGLDRAAAWGWRLLVVGAVVVAALWLVGQLLVVVLPAAAALLAARVLWVPARWLRDRRWPPALAAAATLVGAAVVVGGVAAVVAPSLARELSELGPTLEEAVDDVEAWLVDDAPVDVTREDLDRWRAEAGDRVSAWLGSSGGGVAARASLLVEVPAALLLAVVLTFFAVKDGDRLVAFVGRALPARRRPAAARAGRGAWQALGGFLRGAAVLGAVEGVVIGLAVALVGGGLVAPIVVLTFAAAFVPIVGAIVAGVVAVLVTLATAGLGPAVVVGVVALVVQQLDNDLLAPLIYGHALQLHPVVVLVAIVGGGALFGFVGAVLAVPVTAVAVSAAVAARGPGGAGEPPGGGGGSGPPTGAAPTTGGER